ncbi:MAG: hypothetical protein M0Z52_03550 [Actinomycetota bacterium]|nr:hypothetical protein [Actinomycetota bacterium]
MADQLDLIKAAGFKDVEFAGDTPVSTSNFTVGALFKARKPL